MKAITLYSPNASTSCGKVVRITDETDAIIRKLKQKTGLSGTRIMHEIITQAEKNIIIQYAEEE